MAVIRRGGGLVDVLAVRMRLFTPQELERVWNDLEHCLEALDSPSRRTWRVDDERP